MTINNLPLLSLQLFLPLVGVAFILMSHRKGDSAQDNSRKIALAISTLNFALTLVGFSRFDVNMGGFQLIEKYNWSVGFNSHFHLGVDGLSMALIALTTLLIPIVIVSSWSAIKNRIHHYMILFLLAETLLIGSFCALDFILFYLFFESVLIPMFFIIGIWGGEHRVYAALKFFLYTFFGSIFMLIALLTVYSYSGSMNITQAYLVDIPHNSQLWIWFAFFMSFAVKIPIWPFHTWLPQAHVEAPTAGSVILAGVMLKLGGYGFLRFSLPLLPDASQQLAPLIFVLSLIAVIYSSLVAMAQKDMKKLIAYSSVAHMGFVTFGIFTCSPLGITGSIFQMISHGLVSAGLFLAVGVLYDRIHSREIAAYGGLTERMPRYATALVILSFAAIGLPGTSGFVGEILVLIAAFKTNGFMAGALGLSIILGAGYMLWMCQRILYGKMNKTELLKIKDLNRHERVVMVLLCSIVVTLGVVSQPLLDLAQQALPNILNSRSNASPPFMQTVPANKVFLINQYDFNNKQ